MTSAPAWVKELGLFQTASCVIVPSDAPVNVKAAALVAKSLLGARIQLCDGVGDQDEIQAAIDALPTAGITGESFTPHFALLDNMDDPVSGGGPYTWVAIQGDETLTLDADRYEGTGSLKVVGGATDWPGARITGQDLDWTNYNNIQVYVKADAVREVRLRLVDTGGNYSWFRACPSAAGSWLELQYDFTQPDGIQGDLDFAHIEEIWLQSITATNGYTFRVDWARLSEWVQLYYDGLVPETADISGQVEDIDYDINYRDGKIKGLVGGGMVSGDSYDVSYTRYVGGTVVSLEGNYVYADRVRVPSKTELIALGDAQFQGPGGAVYDFITNSDWTDGDCDISIEGFKIDAGFAAGAANQRATAHFVKVRNLNVDEVDLANGYTHCFGLVTCENSYVNRLHAYQAWGDDNISTSASNAEPGGVHGGRGMKHAVFTNCHSEKWLGHGVHYEVEDGSEDVTFINCVALGENPDDHIVGWSIGCHPDEYPSRNIRIENCEPRDNWYGFQLTPDASLADEDSTMGVKIVNTHGKIIRDRFVTGGKFRDLEMINCGCEETARAVYFIDLARGIKIVGGEYYGNGEIANAMYFEDDYDIHIEGTTLMGFGEDGIRIRSDGYDIEHIQVVGNTINKPCRRSYCGCHRDSRRK